MDNKKKNLIVLFPGTGYTVNNPFGFLSRGTFLEQEKPMR